ncbi:HAD family hydrolase [Flavobacterium phragmitis]|uniref:Putative hydrolase of the HAD superfamily n=1 Tax=Flavobacterium phragmitis TaxID=739143 RepID=A0A1I1UZF3_9FLAO|nr:HAD family hydrolase [Flavobacterium phragmitis]SFD73410.1 putative hydrolase of the HAD superfamily [Flavobacterium phragmitis]
MKFKGILLDIDNTLYHYDTAHNYAKNKVIEYCSETLNFNEIDIKEAYENARRQVNIELAETAASHNRLLYFQKTLESLQVNPLKHSFDIYNIYWDNFLEEIQPYEGIYDFLEKYKGNICLVTDLTAHIQYRKIKQLQLDKYCNHIVTSEEAGREKPHPYMFMVGLKKLQLQPNDVCMIGDNFKKDIFGATNLGIKSIWLNESNNIEDFDKSMVLEAKTFKEILDLV